MATGRVLIVDDDDDAREALAALAESWGHDVATAPDGPTAVSLAGTFRPHVVILDLGLPGMDGVATAELIRQTDGQRAFVIALTGWTRELDREAALRAGCSLFFLKPADLDELERTLARVVALAEGDDEPTSRRTGGP